MLTGTSLHGLSVQASFTSGTSETLPCMAAGFPLPLRMSFTVRNECYRRNVILSCEMKDTDGTFLQPAPCHTTIRNERYRRNIPPTRIVSHTKQPHFERRAPRQPHTAGSRRSLTCTKLARSNHRRSITVNMIGNTPLSQHPPNSKATAPSIPISIPHPLLHLFATPHVERETNTPNIPLPQRFLESPENLSKKGSLVGAGQSPAFVRARPTPPQHPPNKIFIFRTFIYKIRLYYTSSF